MKTFGLGLVGCGGMGRSLAVSANRAEGEICERNSLELATCQR